ncbi:MAG TPA: hypothetical protein PLV87_03015 [Opitutaceae bacterium]|nr:hypothetical protein [Opitutaceae bacterium]
MYSSRAALQPRSFEELEEDGFPWLIRWTSAFDRPERNEGSREIFANSFDQRISRLIFRCVQDDRMPDGTIAQVHQRMGWHVASNGRFLTSVFMVISSTV